MGPEQRDRVEGTLVGVAAGDALGAGYEFTHPGSDADIDMIGGGLAERSPGGWTDDTAMTVAIARAATEHDLRTPAGLDAVAAGFAQWFAGGPLDAGIQTSRVLARHPRSAQAMREIAAAVPGQRAGNGSLMRTAPVALAYLDDPAAMAEAAVLVSDLTHADPRAGQACALWCSGLRTAVLGRGYEGVWAWVEEADPEPRGYWAQALTTAERGGPQDFPNNGWVVAALQTAWWAITHAPDEPAAVPEALRAAVLVGGDTDTTAAIAGAMLGARWGRSAVPEPWQRLLHGWPGIDAPALAELAVAVATRTGDR